MLIRCLVEPNQNGVNNKMKIEELDLIGNDVYFMEIVGKKIVVNDNYNGIMIFDNNLKLIKKLFLIEELAIYSSFSSTNELLLFCPDNNCLIYINIQSFYFQVISLKGFENLIFAAIYKWNQKEVILSSYQREFIKVDLNKYYIQKLDFNDSEDKDFEKDYIKLSKFNIYKIYALEKRAFIEKSFSEIAFIKYQGQIEVLLTINKGNFHDFEAMDNCIAKIGEEKIVIIYKGKRKVYNSKENYSYLRGKFIKKGKDICLYLLSSHNSNLSVKIEKYKIILSSLA